MILLDGDAKSKENYNLLGRYLKNDIGSLNSRSLPADNILTLPTFLAPESYYYYVLKNISNDREFWRQIDDLNLKKDYTSHRLETILNKVNLCEDENISNSELKETFHGNTLASIKEFIKDAQVFTYYYKKHNNDIVKFKSETQRVFSLVEKKVKANLK